MAKALKLSEQQWTAVHSRLSKDYHSSVILIREKMKVVLGFTVRRHREWIKDKGTGGAYDGYGHYENSIRLDFYDEPKRVFFLLKYGEILQGSIEHEY